MNWGSKKVALIVRTFTKILGLTSLANGASKMIHNPHDTISTVAVAPARVSLMACMALATSLAACSTSTHHPAAPANTLQQGGAPLVHTASGDVRGFIDNGISVFRGIPFAGDVSGEGRWHPPGPAPHWQGVRDGTHHGPICPQTTQKRNGVVTPWLASFTIAEDCLNLSVYSPRVQPAAKAPVMVWIHGGFARLGTGSRHDGKALAERGVVVVTINYRLDRLGLFAHPALSASQPDELLANYGLMDMTAALHWVHDNISAFGGDPGNVTIFGQSSGGVAVTALMASPMTRGLYHRAIAQSGTMANLEVDRHISLDYPGSPSLEKDGQAMAAALGIKPTGNIPAELRALSWESIIAYTESQPAGAMVPVTDGHFIPGNVDRAFAAGRQNPTPLMIGSTSWEQSLVVNFNLPLPAILRGVSVNEAHAAYPGVDDKTLVGEWFADSAFHAPARFLARQVAAHGEPAWVYRFSSVATDKQDSQPGAAHGADVPYLFEPVGLPSMTDDEAGKVFGKVMTGYWANFARTGNPNGPGLPRWTPAGTGDLAVMVLDAPAAMQPDPFSDRIKYHLQRYEKMLATPQP